MVHVERPRLVTMDLVVIPCRFEESLLETIGAYVGTEGLPEDWNAFPWSPSTQQIGRRWFEEAHSVVLEVPSAVVPSAKNYLLNPKHARFEEVKIGMLESFVVDLRLGR